MIGEIFDQHPGDQVTRLDGPREIFQHPVIQIGILRAQERRRTQQFHDIGWDGVLSGYFRRLVHEKSPIL
jgi:hypothetical protein